MNWTEQLREEISRSVSTLRRRYANTADAAERKTLTQRIAALGKKLTMLDRAALLRAADILADTGTELEKAVAAAKVVPFDGYLAAMEAHLQNLYTLSGVMHASESLPPAPEERGVRVMRPARTRHARSAKRAVRAGGLPLAVKDFDPAPDDRSAASGVTSIARSVGASISPALSGVFLASPALLGAPFLVAGGLKVGYDLLLYRNFNRTDIR